METQFINGGTIWTVKGLYEQADEWRIALLLNAAGNWCVAWGFRTHNGYCEWSQGHYFMDDFTSAKRFFAEYVLADAKNH